MVPQLLCDVLSLYIMQTHQTLARTQIYLTEAQLKKAVRCFAAGSGFKK